MNRSEFSIMNIILMFMCVHCGNKFNSDQNKRETIYSKKTCQAGQISCEANNETPTTACPGTDENCQSPTTGSPTNCAGLANCSGDKPTSIAQCPEGLPPIILPQKKNGLISLGPPTGLGMCHWIGGPLATNPDMKWAYSGSTNWDLSEGDDWAAIEPSECVFNWKQIDYEVDFAKSAGKKMWLYLGTSSERNKEHNVPKWAIDSGVEMVHIDCGEAYVRYKKSEVDLNNKNLVDASEVKEDGEYYLLPWKIPPVFDPVYRAKFGRFLMAAGSRYENRSEAEAVVMMAGGNFGEMSFGAKCPWWGTDCVPDVLNPTCPVIQSLARVLKKTEGRYAEKTVDEIAKIVASKSDCQKNPCEGSSCKNLRNAPCYVVEDYWLEGLKDLAEIYVSAFPTKPLIVHAGGNISGSGSYAAEFAVWATDKYGSRIWHKFAGWGPQDPYFAQGIFENNFGNKTRHGYELGVPYAFSKTFWEENNQAQIWCDKLSDKPNECQLDLSNSENRQKVAKKAIATAIKNAIVDDRSSYLCMQGEVWGANDLIESSPGKKGNGYYFNPNDHSIDCKESIINAEEYGVGFCPGFLEDTFNKVDSAGSPPPF